MDLINISSISFEDLQEEYEKLRERCSQLTITSEQDTQRIHELKRSLETATAAEAYLVQELEQLSSLQTSQEGALLHKKQNELDELKKRQSTLLMENEELQQDVVDLRNENESLNQKLKEVSVAARPPEIAYQIPKEYIEQKERLEVENLELLAKLDEKHEQIVHFTMSLAEKEKHIEILKDQVLCLNENLQSKREELEEKSHLLESAQEQVVEMNAKIALLTASPDSNDRKGNSLFAEVDDQRQAMKQLLAAQKKSYEQMKKTYNDSQHEIRRLKRENFAMHNELNTCSTIFCNADKVYKEKLNERIFQLLKQNEGLEKKLMITQQELISMANDKGVVWLDSMLLFCKNETDELKKQLHSNRIQMGILEEQLRNSQQALAKWKFEALKTRCVLLDRESLLTDNKIEFKIFTNKDVKFTSHELESAKPNLGFAEQHQNENRLDPKTDKDETSQISVIEIEDDEVELIEDKDEQKFETISESAFTVKIEKSPAIEMPRIKIGYFGDQAIEHEDQRIWVSDQADKFIKKELPHQPSRSPISKTKPNEIKVKTRNLEGPFRAEKNHLIKTELDENKENIYASCSETLSLSKICAKESLSEFSTKTKRDDDLDIRQSILVTRRNVLDEGSNKTVHFAKTETSTESIDSSKPKFICKSTRTKSNVTIRRILVHSKSKSEPSAPPIP